MKVLISIVILLTLIGCSSLATEYRKTGFNTTQRGFACLEKDASINETVVLKNVVIHVVGDREKLRAAGHPGASDGCAGWSNTKNEICVFGRRLNNGQIAINQAVLGHEVNHLLNFNNGLFVNPDMLDKVGG